MLKTYQHCPKKFYFRYVKNLNMPTNDEIFETGKNIHALASYYLKKDYIDKMELSLSNTEKDIWNYLKNISYFKYDTVGTEYNLTVKIDDFFFGGRLDALVQKDERFYILDYKTGGAPKNAENDYQTMIYLLAVNAFYKTNNISFVYLDLKNKQEFSIDLTEERISKYKKTLIEIAKNINNEDFSKQQTNCHCEYKIICY